MSPQHRSDARRARPKADQTPRSVYDLIGNRTVPKGELPDVDPDTLNDIDWLSKCERLRSICGRLAASGSKR
jgi:hypothetical protein